MRILTLFLLWCLLMVLCWPVAVLALVAAPLVWLVSLPVRLVVWVVEAALLLVRDVLFLPARMLGQRASA